VPARGPPFAEENFVVALSEIFKAVDGWEQPRVDQSTGARSQDCTAIELGQILKADFELAVATLALGEDQAAHRRALVRCFGSLLDGLANALRYVAETACSRESRQLRDLRVGADARVPVLQRIDVSYRVIVRGLSGSPLTSLGGKRWEDLRAAVEIRNRVAHPQTPCDLGITGSNVGVIIQVAQQLISDFETLARWQSRRQPHLMVPAAATPRPGRKRKRRGFKHHICA
jgi:hypothetical protein